MGEKGKNKGERGREEKRGRKKETINFKFFLLLGTQRDIIFVSDC